MGLEDAENDVLFARAGDTVYAHLISKVDEFRGGLPFEFSEIHVETLRAGRLNHTQRARTAAR